MLIVAFGRGCCQSVSAKPPGRLSITGSVGDIVLLASNGLDYNAFIVPQDTGPNRITLTQWAQLQATTRRMEQLGAVATSFFHSQPCTFASDKQWIQPLTTKASLRKLRLSSCVHDAYVLTQAYHIRIVVPCVYNRLNVTCPHQMPDTAHVCVLNRRRTS